MAETLTLTKSAAENVGLPRASQIAGQDIARESGLVSDGTCLFSADGRRLVSCEGKPTTYRVPEGVVCIEPRAFAFQRQLREVELPYGLESIGDEAFYACNALARINIPESVRSIGEKALFCTVFDKLHLPAGLEHLGRCALVSIPSLQGKARLSSKPLPMPRITVDDVNARFFVESDFLCGREHDGTVHAIRYVGDESVVRIPPAATHVDSYALLGAKATRALRVHPHIAHLGFNAVMTYLPMDYIQVDLPEGGPAMLYPAESCRALPSSFFCGIDGITKLAESCDGSLLKMKAGGARTRRIICRMRNGVFLSDAHHRRFRDILRSELDQSVGHFAQTDDVASLRGLADLGIVDGGNVERMVEIANRAGGVAATRALLEASRHMRRQNPLDLDL